jgi:polygalacturonase
MKIKNSIVLVVILTLLTGSSCNTNEGVYNIGKFGARGDGKKNNTAAINKAIEACSKNGGGTVLVPPGRYITGTIELKQGVNLWLDHGAILFGSGDTSDYRPMNKVLFSEGYTRYGLIFAKNTSDISISGYGEINGNGTSFMNSIDKPHLGGDYDRKFTRQGENFMKPDGQFEDGPVSYEFRPGMMITMEQCENITISGVTMKDAPEWTVKLEDCDDAEISGITITNNKLVPNSDGIHCTTSRNIRISDCSIFAGDDAIIVTGFGSSPLPDDPQWENLKQIAGNKTGLSENITVTNCVLSSRSACIRVGYGKHPIRNLVFSNLVMYDSNRGIGVFARDNSRIENILFSDIVINNRLHSGHWWGKGEPIHISAIQETEKGKAGTIENIRFTNITANSETGILISGTDRSIIKDIFLSDIKLKIKRGKYSDSYGGNFDLRPAWPLNSALFSHDIPGLYAGYVENLIISNFELSWGEDLPSYFTEAINIDNFKNVKLENITVNPAHISTGKPAVVLNNGVNATLRNINTEMGIIPYHLNHVIK